MSTNPKDLVRSLLAKTVEADCTEHEEDSAVTTALGLISKHGLDRTDFVFPPRFDRSGVRLHEIGWKEPTVAEPAAPPVQTGPRIIRVACEELLREVIGKDDHGYTVGHAYLEILRRVKVEFPGGQTSVKCLRWYATHMRERDERLPQKRARSAPGATVTCP
jgi:hypothetical protein